MPKLNGKDVPPGPWRRVAALPTNRYSGRACPVCGGWLHQLLIDLHVFVHPLCTTAPLRGLTP
jgi:hypothetical protein